MASSNRPCTRLKPPTKAWKAGVLLVAASPLMVSSARLDAAPDKAQASNATPSAVAKRDANALTQDQIAVHVLNRLAFGPRPGDVADVERLGVARWIDAQLDPNSIDDSAIEKKLAAFQTLNYSISKLLLAYESDQMMTRLRREERQRRQALAKGAAYEAPKPLTAPQQKWLDLGTAAGFKADISLQVVAETQNAKILRALESKRQLQEVLVDFWTNHFNVDVKKQQVRTFRLADERDAIRPHVLGRFRDLLGASAHSPAMLIYLDNARSTIEYSIGGNKAKKQKQAAAPVVSLSNAVASDVAASKVVALNAPTSAVLPNAPAMPTTRGGINENYARELMELHTLGVGGGYTQRDVQEVARCFTGWSIDRESGAFHFYPKRHDDGPKIVLGHPLRAGGGQSDGEQVLDILASHPSTARFIATKMCQRLVCDAPPKLLVERVAQVFLRTKGDLKAVTRAIISSPEFMAPSARRAKIKSPFEYSISAARALDATYIVPDASDSDDKTMLIAAGASTVRPDTRAKNMDKTLAREIGFMGQPLYAFQAPTGYSENSSDWVSSGALIARLNFALDLTNGRIADLQISRDKLFHDVLPDDKTAMLERLENVILQGDVSSSTRKTLASQIAPDAPFDAAKIGALLLGSPEFQRR